MSAFKVPRFALLFLFVYVYIFQPPVFNKIYYAVFGFLLFLFLVILRFRFFCIYFKKFRFEICTALVVVFFAIFRDIISAEIVYADRFLIWFFQCLLFPFVILTLFRNKVIYDGKQNFSFIEYYYKVAIFAGFITVFLIAIPSFDRFYESIQVDPYYEMYESFDFRYRAYGISENLTFTYGYLLGVFAGYALTKLRFSISHLFIFLLLSIGVAFNARIGFLPILISIIYIFFIKFRLKTFFVFSSFIVTSFFAVFLLWDVFFSNYLSWSKDFFIEIALLFSGEKTGTFKALFVDFIIIPNELSGILFGTGRSLYLDDIGNTDIGYILQLNYAGVFFVFILVAMLLFFSLRLALVLGLSNWLTYIFMFSVFLLNFKGFLFAATPGARALFSLYVLSIFLNRYRLVPNNR